MNIKLNEMRNSLMKQKMLMVKIMLKQLQSKKVDFKEEALVKLYSLNDQMKLQYTHLKQLGHHTPVHKLKELDKHDKVDIETQLKN